MATLAQDNFNRTANTTVVGSPQVGPAPTVLVGVFGVNGTSLYASTVVTSEAVIVWDVATAAAEVAVTRAGNIVGSFGLVVCAASATDYYWLDASATPMRLHHRGPGGGQPLTDGGKAASSVGDRVWLSHNNGWIRAGINGTECLRYLVTEAGLPIPTSTRHGVRSYAVTNPQVDDLLIVDAPAAPALVAAVKQPPSTTAPVPDTPSGGFSYRGRDLKTLDIAGGA